MASLRDIHSKIQHAVQLEAVIKEFKQAFKA
jgi:hypothetical protein